MKINAVLSGISYELYGSRTLTFEGKYNVGKLKEEIQKKIPELSRYSFHISVNGLLADNSLVLAEEDDILVFSPFAGG